MEQQEDNLDLLITSFNRTLDKESTFLRDFTWESSPTVKGRRDGLDLHYTITDKKIVNATKIVNLAVSQGKGGRKDVLKVIQEATKLFIFFKTTGDTYTDKTNYMDIKDSGLDVTAEVSLQADISQKIFTLQTKMKGVGDQLNTSKVGITLFNDVPIPILLSETAELDFPEILSFLEKRREE